jgi:hypothetical protein
MFSSPYILIICLNHTLSSYVSIIRFILSYVSWYVLSYVLSLRCASSHSIIIFDFSILNSIKEKTIFISKTTYSAVGFSFNSNDVTPTDVTKLSYYLCLSFLNLAISTFCTAQQHPVVHRLFLHLRVRRRTSSRSSQSSEKLLIVKVHIHSNFNCKGRLPPYQIWHYIS